MNQTVEYLVASAKVDVKLKELLNLRHIAEFRESDDFDLMFIKIIHKSPSLCLKR